MKRRTFGTNRVNIWPGFVDALATLIMAIIFVLMIFVVAQVYLSKSLTSKDAALTELTLQLQELNTLLETEKQHAQSLLDDLTVSEAENAKKQQLLESTILKLSDADTQITETAAALLQLQTRHNTLEKKFLSQSNQLLDLEQKLSESNASLSTSQQQYSETQILHQKLQIQLRELTQKLSDLQEKRTSLTEALTLKNTENNALNKKLQQMIAELQQTLSVKGSLENSIADLKTQVSSLQTEKTGLQETTKRLTSEKSSLADQKNALTAALATAAQNQKSSDKNTDAQEKLILQLQNAVKGLKTDISRLNALLESSEAETKQKQVEILNLGKRLNSALAAKVESLSRYQSQFMSKLRDIIGNRSDIRILDDRFIFQSEVLFQSGSAQIAPAGQQRLRQFSETLLEISDQIPAGTDWILRVDGHTDKRPINTLLFPDNWALSTARARAVIRYLIDQGIPPEHLAATGFGQYRPLDPADDEIAYRRNRRIEMRLTSQ